MKNNQKSSLMKDLRHPILRWGFIFVIPGLISFALFTFYPIARMFFQSFFLIRGASDGWVFNGINNYKDIFIEKIFWESLGNTFVYVLMTVPFGVFFSFIIAIMLQSVRKTRAFFRSVFFIPSVAGVVSIGIIFGWMYEPFNGLINLVLSNLHLPKLFWLRSADTALMSIAIMTIWRTLGYNIVILLASLLSIPHHYYEAAAIDGVGILKRHYYITIPLIFPTLLFVFIYNTIQNMQVFSEIFVMTGGGPGHSTTTIGYRIYQNAFVFMSMGKAAANAVVLLFILIMVTLLQMKITKRQAEAAY